MRLGAGGRGASQSGPASRELLVDLDPPLAGGGVEAERAVRAGEPQRRGGRRREARRAGRRRGRSPNGSSLERSTATSKKRLCEAIGELGGGEVAQQLVAGDVPDDPDVRGAGAQRVVAHDRLQRVAVPRLANDRRERVPLAREHLQDLRELLLENEPALVRGCVEASPSSTASRTWAISPSPELRPLARQPCTKSGSASASARRT